MRDGDDLRLTAFHEAGHAVVMHVLGHVPMVATIEPNENEGTAGHARQLYADGLFEGDAEAIIDYAAMCFAGELARVRAGGNPEEAALGAGSDREDAAEELRRLPTDETQQAREKAARILEERWPAVEAVAEALLYLKTLEGLGEIDGLVDRDCALRDCVVARLGWGRSRSKDIAAGERNLWFVPEDALGRFGLTLSEELLAFWREQWAKRGWAPRGR